MIGASEAETRQRLMSSGMIVYIDPAGKKSKSFGIRILPLGAARGMNPGPRGKGAFPDRQPMIREWLALRHRR